MAEHYLRLWDRRSKIYLFSSDTLEKVVAEDAPSKMNGFLKKFIFGKDVICYQENGKWKFIIDNNVFSLSDIEDVVLNRVAIFDFITLKTKNRSYGFTDCSFIEYFARKIDATYDHLDKELMFGFWLKDLLDKENK